MTELAPQPDAFGKYISIIHRCARAFLDRKLAHINISSGHMPFISHLSRNDGLSQDELSGLVGLDKTTTARAIKSLVDLGYVIREHDPEDKRMYHLHLSQKGKALIPEIRRLISEWNAMISHNLSPVEKSRLQQDLKKMSENARQFKENDFRGLPERDSNSTSA